MSPGPETPTVTINADFIMGQASVVLNACTVIPTPFLKAIVVDMRSQEQRARVDPTAGPQAAQQIRRNRMVFEALIELQESIHRIEQSGLLLVPGGRPS